MATVPAEAELKSAVTEILRKHDLEKITLRMVMSMLCERFSVDPDLLAPHKRFVRETINDYLEELEPSPVPTPAPRKRKAAASSANGPAPINPDELKPVRLTGIERAVVLAEPLATFLGQAVIPRSHIPKRISEYSKLHDLQDQSDRRKILCDDALKAALKVDHFTFFSLAKIVSGLVYKPDECDEELQVLAKEAEAKYLIEKQRKRDEEIANGTYKQKKSAKRAKVVKGKTSERTARKPSAIMKPMQLSEELAAVCGEPQLARTEVVKKIWVYIRENQLKDPSNGNRVICDAKLQAVFDGNSSVTNMGINKFLSAHLTKIE